MALCKDCIHYRVCGYLEDDKDATTVCKHFKTVIHSKWIGQYFDYEDLYRLVCANCDGEIDVDENDLEDYKFCPFCGANNH